MAFQQGLSGLNAASKALDVIGNNISNSSTVGFKSSTAHFADVYANSLAGAGAAQVGIGTTMPAIQQSFTQGNITTTNNPLDLAINGGGFYRMNTNGTITYSRNGQFHQDKSGYIVDDAGRQLTGYPADATGSIVQSSPIPLQMDASDQKPVATGAGVGSFKGVRAIVNLDSRSSVPTSAWPSPTQVAGTTWSPDPATYNWSTALSIYDTLGNTHTLSLYAAKTGAEASAYQTAATTYKTAADLAAATYTPANAAAALAAANAALAAANTALAAATPATLASATAAQVAAANAQVAAAAAVGDPTQAAPAATLAATAVTAALAAVSAQQGVWQLHANVDGTRAMNVSLGGGAAGAAAPLTFDTSGKLTTTMPIAVSIDLASVMTDLGKTNNAATPLAFNLDLTGTSQYGSAFGANKLEQDGYTSGRLTGVNVSSTGIIRGSYSNGQSRDLGQVVLTNFSNPNGLTSLGGNQWAETAASGAALVGAPGSASLGVVQSAAIEESNIDLTAELVSMITQQRNYQSNAQTIKTQDAIMQTLVNLR